MSTRLPGLVLVIAAVVMVTGAVIGFVAPSLRDAPPFVTEDVGRRASAIGGNPTAWVWANGLIAAAAILATLGLAAITLRFRNAGRVWSLVALVTFAMGATFGVLDRVISMQVTTWAAQRYPDPTAVMIWDTFERLRFGAVFHVLAFVSIGLYGLAMTATKGVTGLGKGFLTIGTAGILLELASAAIPAYVFLATAALGVASWQLTPGVRRPA